MIEELYRRACSRNDNDVAAHMPRLRQLASRCDHVTEFGMRAGNSTAALLAGKPRRLITYDTMIYQAATELKTAAGNEVEFVFHQQNTLEAEIEETDMLFIDTKHTAVQVYGELTRHADKVRRYLAFHDTKTCGEVDGYYHEKPLGLLWGIGRYMWEHSGEWRLIGSYEDSNGLMVFERTGGA